MILSAFNRVIGPAGLQVRKLPTHVPETNGSRRANALDTARTTAAIPETDDRDRLLQFGSKHIGERCFVIGNGPSLNRMNLSPLKNEITFGLNRIYLLFDELGWSTSYHVTVNRNVIVQWADEIQAIDSTKFVRWPRANTIGPSPIRPASNVFFVQSKPDIGFATRIDEPVWLGATVTYVAIQLAYAMGFKQAILIGVDHQFVTPGEPHQKVVSNGPDPDHFHPDYFGTGATWDLPNLEVSELAYEMAKWQYKEDGREILDATVGGQLQVFPKVDFESLF